MPIENASASVLRILLRPAVRFALRRGIKIRNILEELKDVLVEESKRELTHSAQDVTVSKLAVMTGLQRKEVQRLGSANSEATQHLDLMTRVIGAWSTDKRFSRDSKPLELAYDSPESDFAQLVRGVSQDLNPATILFELERLRLAERSGACVKLLWDSYQISGDVDDAYTLLQRDIHTLVECVDSNIRRTSPIPNLHITTHFDNISKDSLALIREWVLKKGAALHAEIREFVGSFDKDINPSRYAEEGGSKVTICSFSMSEQPEVSRA